MPPLQSPTHSIHDGHTDLLWAINIATMQLQMCCYSQISSQEFALKTKYVMSTSPTQNGGKGSEPQFLLLPFSRLTTLRTPGSFPIIFLGAVGHIQRKGVVQALFLARVKL